MSEERLKKFEPFWQEWYIDSKIETNNFSDILKVKREDEKGDISYKAIEVLEIPKMLATAANDSLGNRRQALHGYFGELARVIEEEIKTLQVLNGKPNVLSYDAYEVIERTEAVGYDIVLLTPMHSSFISYISGKKLDDNSDIVSMAKDICRALIEIHQMDFLHKDLKLENIYMDEEGHYLLGQIGIENRISTFQTGSVKRGTYEYLAPEVYRNKEFSKKADIYSLGIILYILCNDGKIPKELQRRDKNKELPAPCNAQERLTEIIFKAVAYDSGERYDNAQSLLDDLESLSEEDIAFPYVEEETVEKETVEERLEEGGEAEQEAVEAEQETAGMSALETSENSIESQIQREETEPSEEEKTAISEKEVLIAAPDESNKEDEEESQAVLEEDYNVFVEAQKTESERAKNNADLVYDIIWENALRHSDEIEFVDANVLADEEFKTEEKLLRKVETFKRDKSVQEDRVENETQIGLQFEKTEDNSNITELLHSDDTEKSGSGVLLSEMEKPKQEVDLESFIHLEVPAKLEKPLQLEQEQKGTIKLNDYDRSEGSVRLGEMIVSEEENLYENDRVLAEEPYVSDNESVSVEKTVMTANKDIPASRDNSLDNMNPDQILQNVQQQYYDNFATKTFGSTANLAMQAVQAEREQEKEKERQAVQEENPYLQHEHNEQEQRVVLRPATQKPQEGEVVLRPASENYVSGQMTSFTVATDIKKENKEYTAVGKEKDFWKNTPAVHTYVENDSEPIEIPLKALPQKKKKTGVYIALLLIVILAAATIWLLYGREKVNNDKKTAVVKIERNLDIVIDDINSDTTLAVEESDVKEW